MGNNYLRTMPGCPLCHSIRIGYSYESKDSEGLSEIIENYHCSDCGYSWEANYSVKITTDSNAEEYWYHSIDRINMRSYTKGLVPR